MSAPPPATPPAVTQPATGADPTSVSAGVTVPTVASLGLFASFGGFFAFIFALGAAYLSYKTYGSAMWAILDFFFPYIYYPYYAFFLAGTVAPPQQAMFGGKKTIMNLLKMKW